MLNKLLNSKWTSIEKKNGWKHFQVKNVYKNKKSIELFAVCDKKISFIIKHKDIQNKKKWIPGWR
tara:strand:+ start:192 stop:386 length:195 start_codon:yes stop_codon:yes gene_type:complete